MKTIVAIIIVLLVALGLFVMRKDAPAPTTGNNLPAATTTPGGPNAPIVTNLIRVSAPLPNSSIDNPVMISGEARGTWYFEASFPIKVIDADGKEIGAGHAEAQTDWMTTEFVPFKATITFTSPRTLTGTIILQKDNPSGLPENDDEVRVPIRFSSVSPQASVSLR